MSRTSILISLLFFIVSSNNSFGQSHQERALEKGKEAIKLMDSKKYDKAINLLNEAIALDPNKLVYTYELGYAHFLKGERKVGIDIFKKLVQSPEAPDQYYQMLGNFLSMDGDPKQALLAYDAGLNKFPNSGRLYLEKGNLMAYEKKYNEAIALFEKGIEVDPTYPSNYYRAGEIFLNSDEEVWGMIYGELFMNLERNSERTSAMSKLLFDTYKSEIKFTSDTTFTISFSKNNVITLNGNKKKPEIAIPYGMGVFEMTLLLATTGEKNITLASLDRIRENFLPAYLQKWHKQYPNTLFTYQQEINKAGHFEAYNHWLLMKGDEQEFSQWKNNNSEKWNAFVAWYSNNPIKLTHSNIFLRSQYD